VTTHHGIFHEAMNTSVAIRILQDVILLTIDIYGNFSDMQNIRVLGITIPSDTFKTIRYKN
jgi:hypothetical protein